MTRVYFLIVGRCNFGTCNLCSVDYTWFEIGITKRVDVTRVSLSIFMLMELVLDILYV